MINQLRLTLPLPTSINHLYGRNKFGSTYLKKEGKEYKAKCGEYIKEEVVKQGWEKLLAGNYCYLDEVVYMNKKGRDSDNLKKLTQDTITECEAVWFDDTYCLPRTNRIYIDSENPRLEITITSTDTMGIFDSKEECFEFENKCKDCKNYRKGACSKLKDVKDNRIVQEIVMIDGKWTCFKFNNKKEIK